MSVNLHLSVKVSGYDPSRTDAIKQAIQAVFEREQLEHDMSPPAETGEGASRVLSSHSDPDYPVIISSSYKWIPEVHALLSEEVFKANGGSCEVHFDGEDADEGEEDYDDEDDEDEEETE